MPALRALLPGFALSAPLAACPGPDVDGLVSDGHLRTLRGARGLVDTGHTRPEAGEEGGPRLLGERSLLWGSTFRCPSPGALSAVVLLPHP